MCVGSRFVVSLAGDMTSELGETFHISPTPPSVVKVSRLPPPSLTLRGPRVVLRTPAVEDDAAIREILSDAITIKHLPHFVRSGGWTIEDIVLRRERMVNDQLQNRGLTLFIHLPTNNKDNDGSSGTYKEYMVLIGTTGFRSIDLKSGTAEIGIILHHPYWKKGLATESFYLCLRLAFESLGLQRVDWFTSVENTGMRGWCEQLLHLKPFDVVLDDLGDSVGYSLFQNDWQSGVSQFLEQKISSVHG